ncbi:MAG: hypothetical protein DCC49_13040 [Acidobacteria bacterium]|nr:MAG: hypothetical protein DCC49_13040 [Acidobacteriota bacterium]
MAGKRTKRGETHRLILDAGAVIALARNDQRARAYLQRAVELGAEVRIPVVVLAETHRGRAQDAPVHRIIKAVGNTMPTPVEVGVVAGRILGETRRSDTVDALVVAEAIVAGGGRILTGESFMQVPPSHARTGQ